MTSSKKQDADAFLQAFRIGAAHRGMVVTAIDGDSATVRVGDVQQVLSLVEPRRAFEGVFPDDRQAVLQDYLEAFAALIVEAKAEPLERVSARVLPRVNPPLLMHDPPPSIPLVEGKLDLFFVVDGPARMRYISRGELAAWRVPLAKLLPLAIANLRARTDWRVLSWLKDPPGAALYGAPDAFVASRMLLVRDGLKPFPETGVVVAAPDRAVLALAPCGPAMTLDSLVRLAAAARKAAGRRPFPITEDLLWFDGRRWEAIPLARDGEGFRVRPPERFLDALAGG